MELTNSTNGAHLLYISAICFFTIISTHCQAQAFGRQHLTNVVVFTLKYSSTHCWSTSDSYSTCCWFPASSNGTKDH